MADVSVVIAAVDKTKAAFDSITSRLEGVRSGLSDAAKKAAIFTSAAAGIGAALYVKTANAVDAQAKLAQSLDTSYESMSRLARAGDLSGVSTSKLEVASRKVAVAMGQLSANSGPAGDILRNLGLQADQLAAMGVDERIQAINTAISEQVPVTEQAAMAAKLYGEEVGAAIMNIDTSALQRAREETELFGTALSTVEARQIEQANDALSSVGEVIKGALTQATLRLAPIIEGVSNAIVNLAKDSGGMAGMMDKAFRHAVDAAAFLADAMAGVRRVFQVAADGIIIALQYVVKKIADASAWILEKLSKLPGVDFSDTVASLRDFSGIAQGVIDQAQMNISETLMKPLPGEALKAWVADAVTASETAAKASVKIQENVATAVTPGAVAAGGAMASKGTDIGPLQASLAQLQQSLATEEEKLAVSYENRQFIIEEAFQRQLVGEQQRAAMLEQIEADHQNKMQAMQQARITQQISAYGTLFNSLMALGQKGSKRLFEIGKVGAIATATVDSYQAFTAALKGPPGPPWSYGIAAAALASGLAKVASIKSTSFGGSGGAGGTVGGGSMPSPVPSVPTAMPSMSDRSASAPTVVFHNHGVITSDDAAQWVGNMMKRASGADYINIEVAGARARVY